MATDGEDAWREGGLVQRHRHLLDTGFMADCAFAVGVEGGERKRFKCHKFILGHSSAVLHAMFYGDLKKEEVEIPDIQPKHFQKFLQYMYTDTVKMKDVETAMGLAYTAEKYQVQTLFNNCLKFINQNFEDPKIVCQVLEFSRIKNVEELQPNCIDYIKANTNQIFADENFEHAERATLLTILEQEKLYIFSEVDVFSACLRWARSNSKDETEDDNGLAKTLGPAAVKLIRFLTFTADEFANLVVPTKILSEKTCLAVLCRIVTGTGDIPDEVSDCCDSRSALELLGIPLIQDNVYYSTKQVGCFQIVVSIKAAVSLHGVSVLASRHQIPIGGEYEENVTAVLMLANDGTEQMSESFVGLVKRNESFNINFRKPYCMMFGVQYVLRLVYSDPNMEYLYSRPQLSQVLTTCKIPFNISGNNHINGMYINISISK